MNIFGNGFYSLPDFLLNLIDAIYNFPLVVHIYVQVHAYVRVARYIRTCRLTHTYVWSDAYVHILQIGSLHCMLQKDLEDFFKHQGLF